MKLTREEPFRRHKIQYMSLYMYTNSCLFYDMQFHSFVRNVKPLKEMNENGKPKWLVTFSPVTRMSEVNTEVFDAVLVCNG